MTEYYIFTKFNIEKGCDLSPDLDLNLRLCSSLVHEIAKSVVLTSSLGGSGLKFFKFEMAVNLI